MFLQVKGDVMDKYKCSICGFVYNQAKGFPVDGVEPGTPFDSLPFDWVCPVCGAQKKDFRKQKLT